MPERAGVALAQSCIIDPDFVVGWQIYQDLDNTREVIMSIRMFELFHGGVLVKLLRSNRPVTLRMIETQPKEKWSTYTLNDEIDLFITFSQKRKKFRRNGGGNSWTFQFSENQRQQIWDGKKVHIALVCASKEFNENNIPVCLINEEKLKGLGNDMSSITIKLPKRGQFRVKKDKNEFKVPRSGIDLLSKALDKGGK